MTDTNKPAHTFRFEMRSLPVLKSALLVMADQPPEAQALAGSDLTMMAADLLGLLSKAEHETYNRQADTPINPMGNPPRIEADLSRDEAIALAHSLMAVRYAHTDSPMDELILKAMVDFYPQLPADWSTSASKPLTKGIEAVCSHVEGDDDV